MSRALLSIIVVFVALMIKAIDVQAEAWRGIVPLKSTRADVEGLLGRPGEHGRYQFDKERAYIEYAGTGPCAKVNRCLCKVSEDTVISIYVELEVEMSFSGLKLGKKDYKKFVSRKDPTIATYTNIEKGIIYTVDQTNDDITAIEYLPDAKECKNLLTGWKGIVPLETPRLQVEKILGSPIEPCNLQCNYQSGEDRIFVRYSGDPCTDNNSWRVSAGTVTELSVYLAELQDISTLDRRKLKKTDDPELHGYSWYEDEKRGISYSVSTTGQITGTYWVASSDNDKKLRCTK